MRISIEDIDTATLAPAVAELASACSNLADLLGGVEATSRLEIEPRVRGTTVTVGRIVRLLFVEGWTLDEVLQSHGDLCEDDVRAAVQYAGIEWGRVPQDSNVLEEPNGNRKTAEGRRRPAGWAKVGGDHGGLGTWHHLGRTGATGIREQHARTA